MIKKLHLLLALGFWLVTFTGFAQTYPVTISTQLTQPSPIYLSNYADATTINSPIKIQLVLNDLTISNRQIRLKCYFQGNGISLVTNDFVVGARSLYLEGGFPLQLTNLELAPYFEFQNILGINPNQYAQALPEGIYTFAVEVYDFATGKKLSRKTSVTTIIFQNDPPFLNLPLNDASIMQQNIQNIVFSWTPRQINVTNVEYEFSLVEIWDKYTPVQNAFAYSPALYTTTSRSTTLQYANTEPQLIPGKRYAWRVKAKAIFGAEEIGVFKNNGYSEIYAFTYEVFCTAPVGITTDGVSQDKAKITWSGDVANYDYQVKYREKNANSNWYDIVTPRENITISNLKPNATYEYTVGASCDLGKYISSSIYEFTTLANDEIAFAGCGIQPDPKDLANKTPLPDLFPNDVVTAGDFPIVVLHSTGSNGTFSGDGYVTLPFLERFKELIDAADALGGDKINIGKFSRIRITFNNIGVNTDFKLISGEIVAGYDPDWGGMIDGDKILNDITGSDGKPIAGTIDYQVKSAVLNPDGSTTITGVNGQTTIIKKSVYDQVYTDNKGQTVTIPANGTGSPTIGTAAEGGKAIAANTNGMTSSSEVSQISSPDVTITFENGLNSKYAFDKQPSVGTEKLKATYETIPMQGGGVYKVNYKAVSDLNGSDVFIAEANFKNGKKKEDIVFKTNAGAKVDVNWISDTKAEITVNKTLNFGKGSIIATVKGAKEKDPKDATKTIDGKADVAGKVNVWELTQKPAISITLLSVNGASIPNIKDAKDYLNDVYNTVGVKFDVTTQSVTIGSLPNEIQCGNSDILNVYTEGQNNIKNQIESNSNFVYNSETYYVIYTGKPAQNNYKGFMPLGGQYAFVFDNILNTTAHELGHGIFGLKHPFSIEADSGKTDLLMDYGGGKRLSHNDWDIIHSGGWKFYGFQKSAGGALAGGYAIAPDFKLVSTNTYSASFINNVEDGFLGGFVYLNKTNNKEYYKWDGTKYKLNALEENYPNPKPSIGAVYNGNISSPSSNSVVYLFYDNYQTCDKHKYVRTIYSKIKNIIEQQDKVKAKQELLQFINDHKLVKEAKNIDTYSDLLGCGNSGNGDGNGSITSSQFYDANKDNKEIDLNELKIVSDLISKFGDKFYVTYFKPTENQAVTNDNLIVLKNSLLQHIALEESLFGKASFENFGKIIDFIKNCNAEYGAQKEGYIPRCLWDNDKNVPYIQDAALIAGFTDGLIETVVGGYDIYKFTTCFDIRDYRAWTKECFETREKTFAVVKIAYTTFTDLQKLSGSASGIWTGIKAYGDETAGFDNQARYNHGKIIFNVASLFIGVGEAKAILNGEKTLIAVLKESVAAYKQLPKSLAQLIGKAGSKLKAKTINGIAGVSLYYQLNTAEIKIGSIINQGEKAIVKIEVPMTKGTVLETIEDCVYLNADNVVSEGTLEVLEDGGKVGLRANWAGDDLLTLLAKQKQRIQNLKTQHGNLDFIDFAPVGGKTTNDITSSMYNEMFAALGSRTNWTTQNKVDKIVEVLGSGKTIPQKVTNQQGTELFKVVKKGNVPSPTTEYWVTKTELNDLMNKGSNLESKSGLPLGSMADEYDIYKITANKQAPTYRNIIAPTMQRGYTTTGGATQTLVLDRSIWSMPVKYNTQSFIPNF